VKKRKITVPKAVRKKARRVVYERIGKLFAYLAVAWILLDYTYSGLTTTNFGNLSASIFVLLLIPFWASGVPAKLIDRDWCGEIIKLELKNNDPEKIDNHSKAPIKQTALCKSEDGKLYEVEIFDEGEYFFGERENVYKVGDRVIHVKWTEYLYPVRKNEDDRPVACVICGIKSPCTEKTCRSCQSSLEIRSERG